MENVDQVVGYRTECLELKTKPGTTGEQYSQDNPSVRYFVHVDTVLNGNTNAAIIMVGKKATDVIREKELLPPSNAKIYVAPNWETKQREGIVVRPIL